MAKELCPCFGNAAPVGSGASPIPKGSGHDWSYGAAGGARKQLFAQFVEVTVFDFFGETQGRMSQVSVGFLLFILPGVFHSQD
jgi:hypothetical protein